MSKRKSSPVVDKPSKRNKPMVEEEGEDANDYDDDPEDHLLSKQVTVFALLQNITDVIFFVFVSRSYVLSFVGSLRLLVDRYIALASCMWREVTLITCLGGE